MDFETGEEVVWKGRPAYHLRYPILAVIFFIGIFVIDLGPIGQAIGVTSVFLWILFSILSIVIAIVDKGKKYYLTNRRVIAHKNTLLVPDLTNVRVAQSRLGKVRGAGNVYFDSKDGRWIIFKHVKDPAQIAQSASNLNTLSLNKTSTTWTSNFFCSYCGARVPAGSAKCPTCGANQ